MERGIGVQRFYKAKIVKKKKRKVLCCTLPFSVVDCRESFPGAEVFPAQEWEKDLVTAEAWLAYIFSFSSDMGAENRVSPKPAATAVKRITPTCPSLRF